METYSFNEILKFLQSFETKDFKFMNNENLMADANSGPFAGKNAQQIQQINEAIQRATDAGLTMENLLSEVVEGYRSQGFDVAFTKSGRGDGTFIANIIPSKGTTVRVKDRSNKGGWKDITLSASNLANTVAGTTEALEMVEALGKMQHFSVSAPNSKTGLSKKNGQDIIDQMMAIDVNDQIGLINRSNAFLMGLRNTLRNQNSNYVQYLRDMANPSSDKRKFASKKAKGSLKYLEDKFLSGQVVAKDYQSGGVGHGFGGLAKDIGDELRNAKQGVGSPLGRLVRQGYVGFDGFLNDIISKDTKAISQYAKNSKLNANDTSKIISAMADDYMRILSMYAQTSEIEQIESQINTLIGAKTGAYNGINTSSKSFKSLKDLGRWVHALGADPSLSGESSVDAQLLSFLGSSDLGVLGSLRSRGDRKPLQETAGLQRSKSGQKALKKLMGDQTSRVVKNPLYTRLMAANKEAINSWGNNVLYRGIYASGSEIRQAGEAVRQELTQNKQWHQFVQSHGNNEQAALSALGLGGMDFYEGAVAIAEDVVDSLESKQGRSLNLTADQWRVYEEKARERLGPDAKDRRVQKEAMLAAIKGETGLSAKDIFATGLRNETDFSNPDGKTIGYFMKRKLTPGSKIVGSTIKETYAGKLSSLVLDKLGESRGLGRGTVSFVSQYKKPDLRTFGEQMEAYVTDVLSRADEATINKLLAQPALQEWLTPLGDGDYTVNKDIFANFHGRPTKTMRSFINAWNAVIGDNVLTIKGTGANAKLGFNQAKASRATTFNQAALYPYGWSAKGKPVVQVDYRTLGSVDRTLSLLKDALPVDSKSGTILSDILLGSVTPDEKTGQLRPDLVFDEESGKYTGFRSAGLFFGDEVAQNDYLRYANLRKAVKEAEDWSIGSSKGNKKPSTLNLADIANSEKKGMLILGGGSFSDFVKATYSQDEINKFLEQNPDTTIESLGESLVDKGLYINAADRSLWENQAEYVGGALSEESWKGSLWQKIDQAFSNGQEVYAAAPFAQKNKDGSYIGNKFQRVPTIGHKGFLYGESEDEGYTIPETLKGYGSYFSNLATIQAYPRNAKYINIADSALEALNSAYADIESKEGSSYSLQNPRLERSMFGVASPASYKQAESTDFETRRQALAQVGLGPDAAREFLSQYGYDDLINAYHYLNDDLSNEQIVTQALDDLLSSTKDITDKDEQVAKKNQILRNKIQAQITKGSSEYNARAEQARSLGVKLRGLPTVNMRYPLSHGYDTHFLEAYIDNDLDTGGSHSASRAVRPGLGLKATYNADFDGDMLAVIDLLGSMGKFKGLDANKALKELVDFNERITTRSGVLAAQEQKADIEGAEAGNYLVALSEIAGSQDAQDIAGVLSRLNKSYTGKFSNFYQAVNEKIYTDSAKAYQSGGRNQKGIFGAAEDLLVTNLFESVTQDAISSKKIIKRIAAKYATGERGLNTNFFTDLSDLAAIMSNPVYYSSSEGIDQLLNKMEEMQLIKPEDVFSERITNDAYSRFYEVLGGSENIQQLADFLGVSSDQVPLFEEDAHGNATGGMYYLRDGKKVPIASDKALEVIKFSRDTVKNAILHSQENHGNINFGQVIANRSRTVPGLQYNPKISERGRPMGSEEWKELMGASALGAISDSGGHSGSARKGSPSVTSLTSQIFGVSYPDMEPFVESLLTEYAAMPENEFPTAANFNLDDKTFRQFKENVWRPLRGQLADSLEQSLVTSNRLYNELLSDPENWGKQGWSKKKAGAAQLSLHSALTKNGISGGIHSVSDIITFIETLASSGDWGKSPWVTNALNTLLTEFYSPGFDSEGRRTSEGFGFLSGSFINPNIMAGLYDKYGINSKELQDEYDQKIRDNADKLNALFGGDKLSGSLAGMGGALARADAEALGVAMFNTTMSAAGQNLENVGPAEIGLKGFFENGDEMFHGRADRLVFSDDDTKISLLDKKATRNISPQYLMQVFAYMRALQNVQGLLKKHYQNRDVTDKNQSFWNGQWNSFIDDKSGSPLSTLLQGMGIEDANVGGRLLRALANDATIEGGFTAINGETGFGSTYTIGTSLTGNKDLDDKIYNEYLAKGTAFEAWDEGTRNAFSAHAKAVINPENAELSALPSAIKNYAAIKAAIVRAQNKLLDKQAELDNNPDLSFEEKEALQASINDIQANIIDKYTALTKIVGDLYNSEKITDSDLRTRGRAVIAEADKEAEDALAKEGIAREYRTQIKQKDRIMRQRSEAEGVYDDEIRAQERVAKAQEELGRARNNNQRILLQSKLEQEQLASEKATLKRKAFEQKNGGVDTRAQGVAYAAQQERAAATQRQAYLGQGKVAQHGLFGGAASGVGGFLTGIVRSYGFYTIYRKLMEAFSKFIQTAKAMDTVMMNLRIITNGTKEETQQLISSYVSLGRSIGATTQEVAASAIQWQRQGYEAAEVINLVTSSIYLSKLGMIDANAATKDLTSALKGFKLSANESMDVVDKLTAIDLKAAVSAGDVAEGLAQFANLGNLMGVNIDQAAAYVATIADVTQMGGSSAGQAMKMIISRYGNVKAGAFGRMNLDADSEDGSAINDVERVLKKLGISMRKTHSEFKDFDETIGEIADKWNTLDNISQKAIATAFAGTRQQEAFVTLMQNWNKYQELYETSRNSEGTAETKYQAVQESLTAAMNRLTTTIESLVNEQQIGTVLTNLANFGAKIAEALPTLLKFLPQFIIAIQQVRAFKGTSWIQKLGGGIWNRMGGGEDIDGGPFKRGGIRASRLLFGRVPGGKVKGAATRMITGEGAPKKEDALTGATTSSETIVNNFEKAAADSATIAERFAEVAADSTTTAANADKEVADKEQVGVSGEHEAATKDRVKVSGEHEAVAKKQVEVSGEHEAATKDRVKVSGAKEAAKGSKAASAFSGAFTALSFALMQSMSAMMSYMNSDTTHKDKWGDTVTSSKRAAAASRTTETVWSMVPFVGSIIGQLIGSSEASKIDEIYDEIRHNTKLAQEAVAVLDGVSTSAKTLVSVGDSLNTDDVKEANAAADKILVDLYTEENDETRRVIEKYLNMNNNGAQLESIHTLLSRFKNASSQERKNIAKQLEIANLKATQEEKRKAKEEALYNRQQAYYDKVTEYNSKLEGYNELGLTLQQERYAKRMAYHNGGVATLLGGGASAGLGLLGAAAISGPVGLAVGIVGGVASLIGGYFAGKARQEEEEEKAREENQKRFDSMSLQDRIDMVTKAIEEERDKASPDYTRLSAATQFLNELKSYQDYLYDWAEEQDKMSIETAMAEAQGENGTYLTELTTGELKKIGITGIYQLLARQVDANGGLQTAVTSLGDGQPSQRFIDLVTSYLRSDEEIDNVLSGKNYTLMEAVNTLDKTQFFERKILQNFADAMGTTIDDLEKYAERLGMLKLSEFMQSSSELSETITGYEELINDIASGTEEQSAWMGKIITKFPDLIAYMSDTPALMDKIMKKMYQLNEQALSAQWLELMDSDEFFKDRYRDAFLGYIQEKYPDQYEAAVQVSDKYFSKGDDVRRYLASFGEGEGGDLVIALREAFENVSAGITLTADNYLSQAKKYTEYQAKIWQKELDMLSAQRDTLQEITKQREYELSLLKARLKLEEAMNEKQRVYRMGVGWVYEADQSKIQEARDELEELSVEKQIAKLDKEIAYIQQVTTKWSTLWDVRSEEEAAKEAKAFAKTFLGLDDAKIKLTTTENGNLNVTDTGLSDAINGLNFPSTDFGEAITAGGYQISSVYSGFSAVVSILNGFKKPLSDISKAVADKDAEEGEEYRTRLEAYREKLQDLSNLGDRVDPAYYNSILSQYEEELNQAESKGFLGTATQAQEYKKLYWDPWKDTKKTEIKEYALAKGGEFSISQIVNSGAGPYGYSGEENEVEETHEQEAEPEIVSIDQTLPSLVSYGEIIEEREQKALSGPFVKITPDNQMEVIESGNATQIIQGTSDKEYVLYSIDDKKGIWVRDGKTYAVYPGEHYNNGVDPYEWGEVNSNPDEISNDKQYEEWLKDVKERNEASGKGYTQAEEWLRSRPKAKEAKEGVLGLTKESQMLINESGTEAIITPQGTITALPSHTGIVPADITANLWTLGELAPSLLHAMGESGSRSMSLAPATGPYTDESFNINTLTMHVSADNSFDADAFVRSIKARVALTKNNIR